MQEFTHNGRKFIPVNSLEAAMSRRSVAEDIVRATLEKPDSCEETDTGRRVEYRKQHGETTIVVTVKHSKNEALMKSYVLDVHPLGKEQQ